MARNSDVGLKQLANGNWSCRIFKKINGVQIDSTYKLDSRTGEPFRTKSQARDFREFKIAELRDPEKRKPKNKAVTFSYVWDLKESRISKISSRLRRDSMMAWVYAPERYMDP